MLEVDYEIEEFICMLPSDINLWIGKIKSYNDKLLVSSSSSFNIGTDLKINLDDDKHIEKDKPDVKSKKEDKEDIKMMKTKRHIKSKKEDKHNIETIKTKPDMN